MLLFIAAPIVSVVLQSVFAPHEPVLITAQTCTPFSCTEETTIDQEATRALREAKPLGDLLAWTSTSIAVILPPQK